MEISFEWHLNVRIVLFLIQIARTNEAIMLYHYYSKFLWVGNSIQTPVTLIHAHFHSLTFTVVDNNFGFHDPVGTFQKSLRLRWTFFFFKFYN